MGAGNWKSQRLTLTWWLKASEKVREQIRMQANEVGPVLEALLHDTHGLIRRGLNE